jgi:SPP1 gp7 family putative phage head morphogenesis protein
MTLTTARVLTLSSKYGGDLFGRWRAVKGLVRTTVEENDALALSEQSNPTPGAETLARPRSSFQFTDRASKESAFQAWLEGAIDDELVEPVGDEQLRRGGHHTAKWVRGSHNSGLRDAGTRLREKGIEPNFGDDELEDLFNLPVRTRQLGTLYRRNFTELRGIGDATSQAISRALSDGLAAGRNPREIADAMNGEIDDIGINRARTLARTETARSYNMASALRYQENGIDQVNVVNPDPCPVCAAIIADNPHPASEAGSLVPASSHPNCRCAVAPAIGNT